MTGARPDPDHLLAQVKAQEAAAQRGRLRIYFGASAGVGKTYAMLTAARQLRHDGKDIVVGLLETHGRKETEALLQGLEILPCVEKSPTKTKCSTNSIWMQRCFAGQRWFSSTNLPTRTCRARDIRNGAGHRRAGRLTAGIDVFTTLNVQHIESLNDVVGGISTGINVWETVPDFFFDQADEVVMVDVSADDLARTCRRQGVSARADRARRRQFLPQG